MADLGIEKRTHRRYKLGGDLRISYEQGGLTRIGAGRIQDLSDQAVCFQNEFNVPQGADLELRIPWPQRLQEVCDLELVVRGCLIRSESERAVLRIRDYQFQTCGMRSFDQAAAWPGNCNLVG